MVARKQGRLCKLDWQEWRMCDRCDTIEDLEIVFYTLVHGR